jgi:hypothetical protein
MTPTPKKRNGSMDKWLWDSKSEPEAVNVSIDDIPESLLEAYMKIVVWPTYRGGVAEAIMDLMWKAVHEKTERKQ